MRGRAFIVVLVLALGCTACFKQKRMTQPLLNFDVLWQAVDEKYGLFAEKKIDWVASREKYRKQISDDMYQDDFFDVCKQMLWDLKDAHTALITPFNVATYRDAFVDAEPNFNTEFVRRNYLGKEVISIGGGGIQLRILDRAHTPGFRVMYVRYASFLNNASVGALRILSQYIKGSGVKGLILDIRNNTGGNVGYAQTWAGFFSPKPYDIGYIKFKQGPAHNDFSDFSAIKSTNGAGAYFGGPVIVLTNRLVYSAANFFTAAVKGLPNVTIMGDRTGGGAGLPYSGSMPNGWIYNISTSKIYDRNKENIEDGIVPDVPVSFRYTLNLAENAILGIDNIIEEAFCHLAQRLNVATPCARQVTQQAVNE